jgi:hypothetical protein
MAAHGERGHWRECFELFEQNINSSSGLKPSVVSFNVLMNACKVAGEWEKALEVLQV